VSPARSSVGKIEAYERAGGEGFALREGEPVLYLGAAQGQRAARIADDAAGPVVAVEKSPVAALSLIGAAEEWTNLVPYVGDARHPGTYAPLVPELGLLFQDVAQPDQVDIFLANLDRFQPRRALLAVKAPSIAVDRPPEAVFEQARDRIAERARVREVVDLDPTHDDHAMIVAEPTEA
jgi:fibrillarin-like pre-rRNA processing protein